MAITINVNASGRSPSEAKLKCEVVKILLENFEPEIASSVINLIGGITIYREQDNGNDDN